MLTIAELASSNLKISSKVDLMMEMNGKQSIKNQVYTSSFCKTIMAIFPHEIYSLWSSSYKFPIHTGNVRLERNFGE